MALTLCSVVQDIPDSMLLSVFGPYVISCIPFDSASCSLKEIHLVKAGGPLGLSIVGGSDHSSHPFGIHEPGVFISKVESCVSSLAVDVPQLFDYWG